MHLKKMTKDNDYNKGETRTIAVVISFQSEWPCCVRIMKQGVSTHGNLPFFASQIMEASSGLAFKEKLTKGQVFVIRQAQEQPYINWK